MNIKVLKYVLLQLFFSNILSSADLPTTITNETIPEMNLTEQNYNEEESQRMSTSISPIDLIEPANPIDQFPVKRRFFNAVMQVIQMSQVLKNHIQQSANISSTPIAQQANISSTESLEQITRSLSENSSSSSDLGDLLNTLIRETDNTHTHDIASVAERLSQIVLKDYPQLQPTIRRCAIIKQSSATNEGLDIEKWAFRRSFSNVFNILTGICLDAGQILATYLHSNWISYSVIGLAIFDGIIAGINYFLDRKIQSIINNYGNDLQEEQEIIVGLDTREKLQEASENMTKAYKNLSVYIDSHEELNNIKSDKIYTELSSSIKHLKRLSSHGDLLRHTTKGFAVAGALSVGVINLIYDEESLPSSTTATVSLALSSLAERLEAVNSSADIAKLLLVTANTYIELWDLIDLIYATLEDSQPEGITTA